jgi:DnaK suppressor protein
MEAAPDLSVLDVVEIELADVQLALQRLDDGTYATCEICGGPIADARLAERPATRRCQDHGA